MGSPDREYYQFVSDSDFEVENEVIFTDEDVQNLVINQSNEPSNEESMSCPSMSPDSGYGLSDWGGRPRLVMIEEPELEYKFRYITETKNGPNGPLKGEKFSTSQKRKPPANTVGPKVKLTNFEGEAVIRVWVFEGGKLESPSPHRLVTKDGDLVLDEPHDIEVNSKNDYTACFSKLHIVRTKLNESPECYWRKLRGVAKRPGEKYIRNPPEVEGEYTKKMWMNDWKTKEKNICSLYFEAFVKDGDGYFYACNLLSREINDSKNRKTGPLKILKASHVEGSCVGGTEMIILTSRLDESKIVHSSSVRIVFEDEKEWEGNASFDVEKDIHHFVAVTFRTPPYQSDIVEPVTVQYRIIRNNQKSVPKMFRYLPSSWCCSNDSKVPSKRKKARKAHESDSHQNDPVLTLVAASKNSEKDVSNQFADDDDFTDVFGLGPEDNILDDVPLDLLDDLMKEEDMVRDSIKFVECINRPSSSSHDLTLFDCLKPWTFPRIQGSNSSCGFANWLSDWVGDTRVVYPALLSLLLVFIGWLPVHVGMLFAAISVELPGITRYFKQFRRKKVSRSTSQRQNVHEQSLLERRSKFLSASERARLLHLSIEANDRKSFIRLLSSDTVNFKWNGKTPLHRAVSTDNPNLIIVSDLLSRGADPYALDIESSTAVHEAIARSLASLNVLLSSVGPDPVFNKDGDDPLLYAIRKGNLSAMKLLLEVGFPVNVVNVKDGCGPLHLALEVSDEEIRNKMVIILLGYGASVAMENDAGITPLDVAKAAKLNRLVKEMSYHLEESDSEIKEEIQTRANDVIDIHEGSVKETDFTISALQETEGVRSRSGLSSILNVFKSKA